MNRPDYPRSTYDTLREQHTRLATVRTAILHTAREIAVARESGADLTPHFSELAALFTAELREKEALASLMTETEKA